MAIAIRSRRAELQIAAEQPQRRFLSRMAIAIRSQRDAIRKAPLALAGRGFRNKFTQIARVAFGPADYTGIRQLVRGSVISFFPGGETRTSQRAGARPSPAKSAMNV